MEPFPGGILMLFEELFNKATGHEPYPFQKRTVNSEDLPQLIGKTGYEISEEVAV
jgi:hypothetical protein